MTANQPSFVPLSKPHSSMIMTRTFSSTSHRNFQSLLPITSLAQMILLCLILYNIKEILSPKKKKRVAYINYWKFLRGNSTAHFRPPPRPNLSWRKKRGQRLNLSAGQRQKQKKKKRRSKQEIIIQLCYIVYNTIYLVLH